VTQSSNSQVDRLPFRCSRQGLQSFTACRTVFIVGASWGLLLGPIRILSVQGHRPLKTRQPGSAAQSMGTARPLRWHFMIDSSRTIEAIAPHANPGWTYFSPLGSKRLRSAVKR
jgi:hypothetical protein